jgi:hypothetical protein
VTASPWRRGSVCANGRPRMTSLCLTFLTCIILTAPATECYFCDNCTYRAATKCMPAHSKYPAHGEFIHEHQLLSNHLSSVLSKFSMKYCNS